MHQEIRRAAADVTRLQKKAKKGTLLCLIHMSLFVYECLYTLNEFSIVDLPFARVLQASLT